MAQRWTRLTLAAVVLATSAATTSARAAAVVEPPFDEDFALVDLGEAAGVHLPYGGLTFVPDDPDTVLVTGYTGAGTATIYAVGLTRDATDSIASFAGPAVPAVQAYAATAGTAYGPGGVLFYTRSTFEMGEVKPGSAVTDKVVNLRSLFYNTGGLNFVPAGLGDAGALKLVTFTSPAEWWTLTLAPDANGTYDVTATSKGGVGLPGYPTGFAYVAPDGPGPLSPGLVVCERELGYGLGKVVIYDVDDHGDPVVASRRVIVSGLDVPQGVAIDPVTGDVLFVSYQGKLFLLRSAPFPPPTTIPTTTVPTTTSTSTSTSTSAVPTTSSTSSTKPPTTTSTSSTTLRPTTTTSSTSTSSSSSSSSSTTSSPTTTSTSSSTSTSSTSTSSTSTSSSQVPPSSATTTTLPSGCGAEPTLAAIACRVDALLASVRSSTDLGPLRATFVAKLGQARSTLAAADASCAAGGRATARRTLDRFVRKMFLVRSRARSLRARKTIPPALATRIADEAGAVAAAARSLQGALECP